MGKPPPAEALLHVARRSQWRAWLKKHSRSLPEIWLVYFRKHTGRPRLSYNDAVEEALCFGWIDSTVRSIDADRFAQRFSPRRPGSRYSQANQERLRHLVAQGRVAAHILPDLPNPDSVTPTIGPDILEAIRSRPAAWRVFRRFPRAYVRIRLAYIESARRRPAEFRKRLEHFLRMTEAGKTFGYGGIEKHYGLQSGENFGRPGRPK